MPEQRVRNEPVYLGIDGGGTKCRAVLMTAARQILGRGVSGPANPFHGLDQTIASIQNATNLAMADAGLGSDDLTDVVAGIGLAGVNLPGIYSVMAQYKHPFQHTFLTTDLEIACYGAHEGGDGAVIVCGTGSSGFSTVNGQSTVVGAHGFMFGDTCSGAWLGLEAIRAVLLAEDGLGPETQMTERVCRELGTNGVSIIERMNDAKPRDFARLAGLVFDAADCGDHVADSIVRTGASYLSALAGKLWEQNPPALSLLGGLRERMIPLLDDDIASRLTPAKNPPEIGAVLFAQHKFAELLAAA